MLLMLTNSAHEAVEDSSKAANRMLRAPYAVTVLDPIAPPMQANRFDLAAGLARDPSIARRSLHWCRMNPKPHEPGCTHGRG
jgi:hypothetical protein